MSDILEKLVDLHQQATKERSHYYVASCCRDAIAEITRLGAALESERERCAKVADEMAEAAQDGIDILTKNGMADITGRHAALGRMAKNIAASIRALPPPEGKP